MKKNYFFTLILTLCFSALSLGQTVVITSYVDAPCSGAKPRTVEIYVNGTVDFTGWNLQRQSNGGGYTFNIDISSFGSLTDTFAYITNDSTGLNTEFGINTNVIQNSGISSNGDDGFQLADGSDTVIDRFGVDGEDASGKDWEHVDTYVYRKDGSTPNGGSFNVSNWIIGSQNLLDGTCGTTLGSLVPLGSFKEVASTDPKITVTGSTSSFDYFEGNGPSAEQSVLLSGENLTVDINIVAPTNFEVSLTSGSGFASSVIISQTSGSASANVYMRLAAGLSPNSYSGVITASSTGATDVTGNLEGIVSPADSQFTVTAFLEDFNYVASEGLPSEEQTFNVEGLFLTTDLVITAPTDFEISLTTTSGFASSISITPNSGTITQTKIYTRLKSGLSVGEYSGDITVSSTGVTDATINVSGNAFGSVTNSMIITGAYDGSLTGGTPKGIELYVLKDIADLSLFGISSVSNGGGSTAGNVEYPFATGTVSAGTFIYVSTEAPNFTTFFGIAPTYVTGTVTINGDDSIELYESGQIIDVFGDVNKDGSGETWDYLDGWAYRKSNTEPEGTTFTSANWTYSGVDGLEGGTNNATATSPFPIGTYTNATASVKNNSILGFATYPNPITNKEFTISSSNSSVKNIVIFNVLGKKVLSTSFSGAKSTIDVSAINSGIYILKVTEEGKTATKKLVIR